MRNIVNYINNLHYVDEVLLNYFQYADDYSGRFIVEVKGINDFWLLYSVNDGKFPVGQSDNIEEMETLCYILNDIISRI